MNIEGLYITESELLNAVQEYLANNGVDIDVESVEKNYLGKGYKVGAKVKPEFKEDAEPAIIPPV